MRGTSDMGFGRTALGRDCVILKNAHNAFLLSIEKGTKVTDKEEMDEEDLDEEDEEDLDEEVVLADPSTAETSFEEILSKKKLAEEEEEEEEILLDLSREERLESLSIKATPIQANEFVCKSCRLVKHRSQLADKKREFCRDCV